MAKLWWSTEEKGLRCRLSLGIQSGANKGKCNLSKKRGQETQKWIIRCAVPVTGGIWGHLSSSPVCDHCSWSHAMNQNLCSGRIRGVKPASYPGRRQALAVQGGCFHVQSGKPLDRQIEHPNITTLVPIPGPTSFATAHHLITDKKIGFKGFVCFG